MTAHRTRLTAWTRTPSLQVGTECVRLELPGAAVRLPKPTRPGLSCGRGTYGPFSPSSPGAGIDGGVTHRGGIVQRRTVPPFFLSFSLTL